MSIKNTAPKLETRIRGVFDNSETLPNPLPPTIGLIDPEEKDEPKNRYSVGGIVVGNSISIPFEGFLSDTVVRQIYNRLLEERVSKVPFKSVNVLRTPFKTVLVIPWREFT